MISLASALSGLLLGDDINWISLWFLGEPWFIMTWNMIGALGVLWLIEDLRVHNTVLKPAIG